LRVQPPVGFVDRLGGRPGNGGSGLVLRLSLGFAQEQVAGVNAASARAQFAALFDGLIKEDVWKLHGETLLSEHDHSLIRRRHEARRKWPGERISWPVSAVPEADRGEENRAESKQSRRQESGSGAGGGKPPCASRESWKESKNQHVPIKPVGGRDAHGLWRGFRA